MPVTAPKGERSNDNPSEPSVNPSRVFKAGMDVTQIPNKRLEVANKKPTEKIALFFIKEEKFLIMATATMCYWIKDKIARYKFLKKNSVYPLKLFIVSAKRFFTHFNKFTCFYITGRIQNRTSVFIKK